MWSANEFRRALEDMGITHAATIAFSMRSGSTYLCDMLTNNSIGRPTEFFQYPYERNSHFGPGAYSSIIEQVLSIIARHSAGGIFVSKMTHDHRAHLDQALGGAIHDYDGLDSILPNHRWVLLKRHSLVEQAISQYIAEQSNVWHLARSDDAPMTTQTVRYDYVAILANLMILAANNVNWECYFGSRRTCYLTLQYEDFRHDPAATLNTVIRYIVPDRAPATNTALSRFERISGSSRGLYQELYQRFMDDFLRIGQKDDLERIGPAYSRWVEFFFQKQWKA